jgi:hypothetical protein
MSTTTSNGVTGSLVNGRVKVSAREPNMNRTTTILSPGRPTERSPITTLDVAGPPPAVTAQRVAQQLTTA